MAASAFQASGLTASVSGNTVTATATVSANPSVWASDAGICARSSSGANVDFPSTATTIARRGTALSGTRWFAAGTYTYWPCVLESGVWNDVGEKKSFTVGAASAVVATPTAIAPPASSVAMPVGNLPGWTQTFTEDFSTNLAAGSWPGSYGKQWLSYDGFPDTSQKGWYDSDIISAHDGALDLYLHTENGRALGAAPVPLVNGQWGGQTYGRFSVRMKSDALPGYGTGFLLWADSGDWNDGEVDFPESSLSENVKGYNHCLGNASSNCLVVNSSYNYTDWHTYTIDWTPSRMSFIIDGVTVGSTTSNIPSKPLHWVMQVATTGTTPNASTAGHLLIDWATIYRYTP
jgi:hypothetical protein